ncbi:MAG: hypothetical protein NTU95_09010 [Methanothrix sp.]|nr:hypothetical protein [Methanothrix sp.]
MPISQNTKKILIIAFFATNATSREIQGITRSREVLMRKGQLILAALNIVTWGKLLEMAKS